MEEVMLFVLENQTATARRTTNDDALMGNVDIH